MTTELEETLARELRDVAGGIQVPAMPSLSPDAARPLAARLWQPLLVAAAVALIVGVVALALSRQGGETPQPAPPPTGSPTASVTTSSGPLPGTKVAGTPPTVPYVLDRQLYVDGAQVPGDWGFVESRGGTWLAQQYDGSWWSGGPGRDTGRIDAQIDQPPVVSPNGGYVAFVDLTGGTAHLTGFDTQPAGEGFGQAPIDLPSTEGGVAIRVRAVTDDGDVIVQGTRTSLMWRTQYADQQTVVDLTATAPDQVFLGATAAGLIVVDGADGATDATGSEPYLATISAGGQLTKTGTLPTYDDLEISPGGTWLVRSPAGTLGGEVTSVATLRAQPVGSSDEMVLAAPQGWGFANGTWAWEDDENLVAVLLPDGDTQGAAARLVRCSVALVACRGFAGPGGGAEPTGSYSAEEALDSVVAAVVADDRPGLVDQAVIGDTQWDQLVGFAKGGSADAVPTCRDNGGGTKDCEIPFATSPSTTYYAIVEPAKNAYGWKISYVGIGGA